MKRKPLVKLSSDPIPSVKEERRLEAEWKAIVKEFEAIVWTSNVMPLTAVQVDRIREMCREPEHRKELMLLTSWKPFIVKHMDFILLSAPARAMLGREGSKIEMDAMELTMNAMSREWSEKGCKIKGDA